MKKSKKLNGSLFSKIFTAIVCASAICIMIFLADIFSSLITVGGYSFASGSIEIPKHTYYAICISESTTKVLADSQSQTVQTQGGAGYIYMNKSSYSVLASVYYNESDALKVLENIKESNKDAKILEIVIPQISITNNLEKEEKETIFAAVSSFKATYEKLYDISISLDTSLINEVNARLAINELASTLTNTIGNFNTIFSTSATTSLTKIKLALEDMYGLVDTLIDAPGDIPLTSQIKKCYCEVLLTYKNLAINLQN